MSDSWLALKRYTQARIALGHAGHAVPTQAQLGLQLAHARARDAVHLPWDSEAFAEQTRSMGEEVRIVQTQVLSRTEYLRRPDLGRELTERSCSQLTDSAGTGADVALIVSNGLSSTAVECHGLSLLRSIVTAYRTRNISIAPICLVANGRVALSDSIGCALGAREAVIIVGERPGLSAADSLGAYLTFGPRAGNTDERRNCISNIRPPEGLGYATAAAKLLYLTEEALKRGYSGVMLKDNSEEALAEVAQEISLIT